MSWMQSSQYHQLRKVYYHLSSLKIQDSRRFIEFAQVNIALLIHVNTRLGLVLNLTGVVAQSMLNAHRQ